MAGPSGATSRLLLPYPIPDDTVDVPRDVQALATKLDGIGDLGVPYPGVGCALSGITAAAAGLVKMIGTDGTTNPPVRANPAGSLSGAVWTVPAGMAGVWRLTIWARADNVSAGKAVRAQIVKNGAPTSSWDLVWAYGGTAGSYPQGMGSSDLALAVGDTITSQVAHDDTGARTVTWRMIVDRIT